MEEKQLFARKGDNGLYGYVDLNDNWVIEPKFDRANDFQDGEAVVRENKTYKVLLPDGKFKQMSQMEEYIFKCEHYSYDCYGWSFLEASQKDGKWMFDSWYRLMNDNRDWYDMRYDDEVFEDEVIRYSDEVGKNNDFAEWANSLNLSTLEEVGKLLWANAQFLIKEAQIDFDDGGYEAPLYTLSVYLQLYNQLENIESLGLMDLRTQLGLPEEKDIYLDPVKLKAEAERLCDEKVVGEDGYEDLDFTYLLGLSRKPGDYDCISRYDFNYVDEDEDEDEEED